MPSRSDKEARRHAECQSRYRGRRAAGKITVTVEIDEVELTECLCHDRLLDPAQAENRRAIARAVADLLKRYQEGQRNW